jgi:thiol:disulfide interchange protein DsbC
VLLTLIFVSASAVADDIGITRLKERIARALPGFSDSTLRPGPVKGLYEVSVGANIMYISEDGRYLMFGDVIDIDSKQNLSKAARGKLILAEIAKVKESDMVVIAPKKTKRTLTVFTDVDCPYCAKLHQEVPALTAAGVKVRYLFYPRAGIGSPTYNKSVAVWCAKDRVAAIGIAKSGGTIEMKKCDNPVTEHYKLGQRVGVRGTPMIVVDDGTVIGGYAPAAQLLASLGLADNKVSSR